MKKHLKAARNLLRPFVPIIILGLNLSARICFAINRAVGWTYLRLWPIFEIHWYDHAFDQLLAPGCNRWTERGTLANRYIELGAVVLDVACGDGSLSGDYYSRNASQVDAFDYDERAIQNARRKHYKPNVTFFVSDAIRMTYPPQKYDVITLFAVVEHLSEAEGGRLLQHLGAAMKPSGVLVGCTLFEAGNPDDVHRNKFQSAEQLQRFVSSHFNHTDLWCSHWSDRVDCYFECRLPKYQSVGRSQEISTLIPIPFPR